MFDTETWTDTETDKMATEAIENLYIVQTFPHNSAQAYFLSVSAQVTVSSSLNTPYHKTEPIDIHENLLCIRLEVRIGLGRRE